MKSLAGAALAAKAAGEKLPVMKDVVGKLKSLLEPDGTFKSSDNSPASIENTRIAMEVISDYADQSTRFTVSEILETVIKLLPTGSDDTPVDPLLLVYLSKSSEDKIKLSTSQLEAIGTSSLQLFQSNDLSVVSLSLQTLSIISTYKANPIYAGFKTNNYLLSNDNKVLTIEAYNVLGKSVELSSVDVKYLKPVTALKEASLFSGKLEKDNDENFTLDLQSLALPVGTYVLNMHVTVAGRKSSIGIERYVTISIGVDISSVWAGVTDSKQVHLSDLTPLKSENSLLGVTGSSAALDVVHIAFSVLASADRLMRAPHQAFVKFTHLETKMHTLFVCHLDGEMSGGSGYKFQVAIALGDETETFMHISGSYAVSILVGDSSILTPVEWELGEMTLTFPPKIKKDLPLYAKSLLAASDNSLGPLPEIIHKMRPPAKRASKFMSSFFALLALAPLVVLIPFLISISPNLNRLRSLPSLLFVVCIAAVLVLYAAYWLALEGASFYQTMKYLCFLAPLTFVIGRTALASVTYVRIAESKKE